MRKIITLLLALAMLFALTACSRGTSGANGTSTPDAITSIPTASATSETIELIIFAASSMTETLTEIAQLYKEAAPNVSLIFTFDSSGTLKTQIQEGADCDIFISAAQKQMNELDIASEKNTEGMDFILSESRFNLVENKVTLVVPEGNPAAVESFDDIATDKVALIALGNSDVPVGQYSEEILTNMGVWDLIQSKITFGSNVKEVTTWISESIVDCGVIYSTDANAEGLEIVAEAPGDMLKTAALYPAAALKGIDDPDAANDFLEYLKTDECAAIFEKAGFSIPA